MPTSLTGTLALLVAVLLVLRFRRGDLDEDSQAALAKEELRARRLIVQTLIVGTLGTVGLGVLGTVGIASFAAVRIAQMAHVPTEPAVPAGSPYSPAKLAELREARAGLVALIQRLETQLVAIRAQPTRPDDAPYDRNTSTESAVAHGIEEIEGRIEYEMDRIADIDRELTRDEGTP